MTLPLNLSRVVVMLQKAQTTLEQFECLNKLTEEFFRIVGIVFYTRYITIQNEKLSPPHDDILSLIENNFRNPRFNDWIQLGKLSFEYLLEIADEVASEYNQLVGSLVDIKYHDQIREVIRIVSERIPIAISADSQEITVPIFLNILIRILETSQSKLFSSLSPKRIIDTGFHKSVPLIIEKILDSLHFKIIVPISFGKKATKVEELLLEKPKIQKLPPTSEYLRHLYYCYIKFDDDVPFKYRTNLLHYDRTSHNYSIYSYLVLVDAVFDRYNEKSLLTKIESHNSSIQDLFDIPSRIPLESFSLFPTLSQRYGSFHITNDIVHNLNVRLSEYIRRPEAENELRSKLAQKKFYVTTLDGGGGYGKTELSRSVIWDIIETNQEEISPQLRFEYILWTTGQKEYFRQGRIEFESESLENIDDVIDSILYITNNLEATKQPLKKKKKIVIDVLNQAKSVLIILDNLETVAERESIQSYLKELINKTDSNVRVLTTSRIKRGFAEDVVTIGQMTHTEALELIHFWMNKLEISEELRTDKIISRIVDSTGAVPLLIKYLIHILRDNPEVTESVLTLPPESDVALEFMCGLQWNSLSEQGQKLLLGVAFRGGILTFSDAKNLCDLSDDSFNQAMDELDNRSFLVSRSLDNRVLELLPPITQFASNKLFKSKKLEDEFIDNESLLRTPVIPKRTDRITTSSDTIALNQLLQRAELEAKQGAVFLAHSRLKQAIMRFPKLVEAWMKLGEFEYRFLHNPRAGSESFKKATYVDSTNVMLYELWATLEFELGLKRKDTTALKRSIRHYEQAYQIASLDIDRRRLSSLIALSQIKIGDFLSDELQITLEEKRHEIRGKRDSRYNNAIDILERNTTWKTESIEEKYIQARIYGLLAWSYLSIGDVGDEERQQLDNCGLYYLIRGIEFNSNESRIRDAIRHPRTIQTMKRHGKKFRRNVKERILISSALSLKERIECNFESTKRIRRGLQRRN